MSEFMGAEFSGIVKSVRWVALEEHRMLQAVGFGVAVLVVLAAITVIERQRGAVFRKKFPPISDEEFMAQCPPGTSREVALKVRRIVADQLGLEYERIYPSASFVNDLGAD
jgi:hypothetical protein